MKLLILFTSYRQLEEFDYQAVFLSRCPFFMENAEVLVHCNNRAISKELEHKIKRIPCKKHQLIVGTNEGGYKKAHFRAMAEVVRLIQKDNYDFVIHLHPDVFITNEIPLRELLNSIQSKKIDLVVSRSFGKNQPSFCTDFFIFRPERYFCDFFSLQENFEDTSFKSGRSQEKMLYLFTHLMGVSYKEVNRFEFDQWDRDIDHLGLWHEHHLRRIRLYLIHPFFRYFVTIAVCFKHPRKTAAITRDFLLRWIKRRDKKPLLKEFTKI